MKGPRDRGGCDVGSVPASVPGSEQGMRPHVRARFGELARYAVRSAERGEQAGAALLILSGLYDLGVMLGSVQA